MSKSTSNLLDGLYLGTSSLAMLLFLPIMLCCSAHKFHLLCSCERCMLRNKQAKIDCFIRVYTLVNNKYGERSIRVFCLMHLAMLKIMLA